MLNNINYIIESLNSSKFLFGIMMIILNIFSKYVTLKFSKNQEEYIRNYLGRQIFIFAVSFVATKDILISLVLTGVFMILADHLFNEESRLCILPKNLKKLENIIDNDNNNLISDQEVTKAISVLNKAQRQKENFSRMNTYYKFKQFIN